MAVERTSIPLPKGFNPANPAHEPRLVEVIVDKLGDGWEIDSIEESTGRAWIRRHTTRVNVAEEASGVKKVITLPRGTRETDGARIAANQEKIFPGWTLTEFHPHTGEAALEKKSEAELRCRESVANALRCKPWDVQVEQRKDGGFALRLPGSYNHTQSERDKLQDLAENVVGKFGWFVDVNPQTLVAQIIPSEPPTFPPAIKYPLRDLGKGKHSEMPIGVSLGADGKNGHVVVLDFDASPHVQVSGTSGSGKSVLLNGMITHQLAAGCELAIVDVPHKAVDYFWCKEFVRPGGWGCDSLEGAVATAQMVYNEGMERAKVLAEHGVTKVSELPKHLQPKPIFILFDEVTGLIQLDPVPKGIPKDHPLVTSANEKNLLRQTILDLMKKISAELRFVGLRMVLSSQVANSTTGIPPALKTNLANKVLQGSNPTKANRGFALLDATRVPEVPEHIKSDSKANRGVGVTELEGQEPVVYKSFYASVDDMRAALVKLGVPTTDRPSPTPAEIARYVPSLDDTGDLDDEGPAPVMAGERLPSGKPVSSLDPKFGPVAVVYDENGKPLKGAALAAAQAKKISDATGHAVLCPDGCGQPIASDGSCGCA